MRKTVVLLTKDCLPLAALPCYGGCKYWCGKTPNIDALVEKGTKFNRHYTAGGSTAMSMSAMLSGHYLFDFKSRYKYTLVKNGELPSIYDEMQKQGYDCHVIWDKTWLYFASSYVGEFGDIGKVKFHGIDVDQKTDKHDIKTHLKRDDALLSKTLEEIRSLLESLRTGNKLFLWIHIPHIIKGRKSYIDDIDAFDTIVGYAREFFGDDSIYLSSDHGHMNMHKGISGYGFDVYEPISRIPLITPRIEGLHEYNDLTSNIDLPHILQYNTLPQKREFVITETQYYGQKNRRIALIAKRFKYIFNDREKTEELYDLEWDPLEEYNILKRYYYDDSRKYIVFYDEHYFYPYYEEAMQEYEILRLEWKKIWRVPTRKEILKDNVSKVYYAIYSILPKSIKSIIKGFYIKTLQH